MPLLPIRCGRNKEKYSKCLIETKEKCIKLHVQIVEKKQKFHSNRTVVDLSIVGSAIKSVDQDDFSSLRIRITMRWGEFST